MDFNKIKKKHKITDFVSKYVTLKEDADGFLKGHCPFSNECFSEELKNHKNYNSSIDWKDYTPFKVNSKKEVFYCFGCHKGGDVITFLSLMEDLTIQESANCLSI